MRLTASQPVLPRRGNLRKNPSVQGRMRRVGILSDAVAQPESRYGSEGCRFESCRARQVSPGQRAVKRSCRRNRANIACPSVPGEPRKPMSGDSYGPCSPLTKSQHWPWSSTGCGEVNWDALPRRPSDGHEARRSAGLRSSRLSARGSLRTQASTRPSPSGTQHCWPVGGSPPLVWQLGRCRHGTTPASDLRRTILM